MRLPTIGALACLMAFATSADAIDASRLGQPSPPIKADDEPATLTLPEAAALLRVDAAVVNRLAESRQIPARRIDTEWRFSRAALIAWLAGEWKFRTLIDPASVLAETAGDARQARSPAASATALGWQASAAVAGRGPANPAAETDARSDRAAPIGTAPAQRTANEVFLRDQRLLQEPREFTLDLGLLYARRDTPLLTQSNGQATLANAESQGFSTQIIARYGILKDTELFASTSYGHQRASLYAGADRLSRATRNEMGDVGVGLRHTLLHEGPGRPDVILSFDARIPTGETSKAIGAGVTLVKSLDPVVLFGTLGFRRTFSRDFADANRLEPRSRTDLTFGYAFALNDTLSLNTAFVSSFARAASFTNAQLRSSNVSSLQLGMTARVARGLYLQPSLSYRLTGPGSGFAFGINIPVTFP